MAHARRFRFGVEMQEPFPDMTWAQSAQELESLGYSTLFVPDHFHEGFGPITAMATAAAATTLLHVAPLVLATDFRHPAVLARELASIDVLSEGRLEIGLGAGYNVLDYSRSGIRMDEPKVRVGRLMEHVAVLKGLFAPGLFDFAGEHYAIEQLEGTPKPFREGGPPFILAGGAPRMLRFAGSVADIVGVNPSIHSGTPDAAAAHDALPASIDQKFGWVREGAGERFEELEFNAWVSVSCVTNDANALAEKLSPGFGAPAADVLASPITLIGSEQEIADRLRERRERWGYSYTVIQQAQVHELAPVVADLAGS